MEYHSVASQGHLLEVKEGRERGTEPPPVMQNILLEGRYCICPASDLAEYGHFCEMP